MYDVFERLSCNDLVKFNKYLKIYDKDCFNLSYFNSTNLSKIYIWVKGSCSNWNEFNDYFIDSFENVSEDIYKLLNKYLNIIKPVYLVSKYYHDFCNNTGNCDIINSITDKVVKDMIEICTDYLMKHEHEFGILSNKYQFIIDDEVTNIFDILFYGLQYYDYKHGITNNYLYVSNSNENNIDNRINHDKIPTCLSDINSELFKQNMNNLILNNIKNEVSNQFYDYMKNNNFLEEIESNIKKSINMNVEQEIKNKLSDSNTKDVIDNYFKDFISKLVEQYFNNYITSDEFNKYIKDSVSGLCSSTINDIIVSDNSKNLLNVSSNMEKMFIKHLESFKENVNSILINIGQGIKNDNSHNSEIDKLSIDVNNLIADVNYLKEVFNNLYSNVYTLNDNVNYIFSLFNGNNQQPTNINCTDFNQDK